MLGANPGSIPSHVRAASGPAWKRSEPQVWLGLGPHLSAWPTAGGSEALASRSSAQREQLDGLRPIGATAATQHPQASSPGPGPDPARKCSAHIFARAPLWKTAHGTCGSEESPVGQGGDQRLATGLPESPWESAEELCLSRVASRGAFPNTDGTWAQCRS
jgi:hypothetical protein